MADHARRVFVLLRITFKYLKTGLKYQTQVLSTTTAKAMYLGLLGNTELAEERNIFFQFPRVSPTESLSEK